MFLVHGGALREVPWGLRRWLTSIFFYSMGLRLPGGWGAEDCDIGMARRLAATPWSKKISKLTSDGVPHSVTDRKVIFGFEVGGDFLE